MFDTEGQLYFPAGVLFIPNPVHPFWVPEFIGDTIAVNGKVWPFLEVEPKRYRFLFLNGSRRGYEMFSSAAIRKFRAGPVADRHRRWLSRCGSQDRPERSQGLQRLVMLPGEAPT
jgi:hypothetical protein